MLNTINASYHRIIFYCVLIYVIADRGYYTAFRDASGKEIECTRSPMMTYRES